MIEEHTTPNGFAIIADFYHERASTLVPEVHSPESIQQSREIFEKMNDSERLAVFRRIGVEETLSKLGVNTLELESPLCRKPTLLQNGKPVRNSS